MEGLSLLRGTVRAVATHLVELGILESRGSGRARRLHLTARFYDLAEARDAYVRVKGADPLQQERMITDYVAAYGAITRSQAATLCQISPQQARGVLKKMVDDGAFRIVGERRGARYVKADG
jgi:ATP-dependent DNA helicase RecG